jgi:hypothetical protein
MKQYQYINIIIVAALVIYLAYQLYLDLKFGDTNNLALRIGLLVFGLAILVYRILQVRKFNNKQ